MGFYRSTMIYYEIRSNLQNVKVMGPIKEIKATLFACVDGA